MVILVSNKSAQHIRKKKKSDVLTRKQSLVSGEQRSDDGRARGKWLEEGYKRRSRGLDRKLSRQ